MSWAAAETLTFQTLDGDTQQVNPDEIWRIRATFTSDEPSGAVVIDYAFERVYVKGSLASVVCHLRLSDKSAANPHRLDSTRRINDRSTISVAIKNSSSVVLNRSGTVSRNSASASVSLGPREPLRPASTNSALFCGSSRNPHFRKYNRPAKTCESCRVFVRERHKPEGIRSMTQKRPPHDGEGVAKTSVVSGCFLLYCVPAKISSADAVVAKLVASAPHNSPIAWGCVPSICMIWPGFKVMRARTEA